MEEKSQKENISLSSATKSQDLNKKSIMVKNIDFEATLDEIEKLFNKFGLVNKITLICDKYSGRSKGYVCILNFIYVEKYF